MIKEYRDETTNIYLHGSLLSSRTSSLSAGRIEFLLVSTDRVRKVGFLGLVSFHEANKKRGLGHRSAQGLVITFFFFPPIDGSAQRKKRKVFLLLLPFLVFELHFSTKPIQLDGRENEPLADGNATENFDYIFSIA